MPSRAHDTSYKQLFNSPHMVHDLLRGHATQSGLGPLTLSGIEPVHSSFVTPGLRARHSDQIWKLRLADGSEAYAIIEFQSRPDMAMALRTCLYSALLYEALLQNKIIDPEQMPWPAVLCIVIYNGRRPWRGNTRLHERIWISKSGLMRRGLLRHTHVLVDIHAQVEQNKPTNLVSLLMRFEQAQNQPEFVDLLCQLNKLLPHTGELRSQFARWIIERVGPDSTWAEMTQDVLFNQGEVMYLAKRFAAWDKKMERQGERKGEQKGKLETLQTTLGKLLEKRFGPLDAQTGRRIQNASVKQLDAWVLRSVDARSVSEVFEQVR